MEGKKLLRYMFFLFFAVICFFTIFNVPSPPSTVSNSPDCATYSPFCASSSTNNKNHRRIQYKNPTTALSYDHSSDVPRHPLDPLTLTELNRVKIVFRGHDLFKNRAYSLHSVVLEEPSKSLVLKWNRGDELPQRKASVVARAGRSSHVLTVDLDSGEVTRYEAGDKLMGYPTMTVEDMTSASWAPMKSAEFNRTVAERGVDLADVACLPISTGWFGKSEDNRRLIKVQCYSSKDTANFYVRPIEGLTVLVDLDTKKVLKITDKGKDIRSRAPRTRTTASRLKTPTKGL